MEIYDFYVFSTMLGEWFGRNHPTENVLIACTIGAAAVWLVMFVLQGIGLYTMAKRRGMKKKALAFIPFANIYYIGKLSGESVVFGQRMKRAGLYAMIAETIASVLCVAMIASQLYLYINCGEPMIDETFGTPYWVVTGNGVASVIAKFMDVSSYFIGIAQLVAKVLMLILLSGLYKKYSPRNYFFLGVLTIMLPARYLIIFALRNRKAIDYEAYMRARREAYMRQQQQYRQQYYGGYGNSYGNPYQPPQKPEDPFGEFGDKPSDEPFEELNGSSNTTGGDADEFF